MGFPDVNSKLIELTKIVHSVVPVAFSASDLAVMGLAHPDQQTPAPMQGQTIITTLPALLTLLQLV